MEKLKSFFKKFIKSYETVYISSSDAQSLSYFGTILDRHTMIRNFLKTVYKEISQSALMNKSYSVVEIPYWISNEEFKTIIEDLKSKDYNTFLVESLNLIIISWN